MGTITPVQLFDSVHHLNPDIHGEIRCPSSHDNKKRVRQKQLWNWLFSGKVGYYHELCTQ